MKKLLFGFVLISNSIIAQVSSYSFTQNAGSPTLLTAPYTQHTSGTTDYGVYTAIPIGFTFFFNCNSYTTISISNDGYIIMGNSLSNTYTPLSSTSNNNVISALGADLQGLSSGSLRSKLIGTSPNRSFIIEWANYEEYAGTAENYTFQIELKETSNDIIFYYSNSAQVANENYEVGLKGASTADYNNRKKVANDNWTASIAGTAIADKMISGNSSSRCPNGIFTWSPPNCSGTPTAGTATASPATICPGQSSTITLTGFSSGCGISYQWQSASAIGGPYTNIAGANNTVYTASPTSTTYYRCITTCSNSGASNTSSVATVTVTGTPTYATIPYSQSFEGPWLSVCSTREKPDNSWANTPVTGNASWRRNDDGVAGASWSSNSGAYTPASTLGTFSARFHSYDASSGNQGSLDLYVNLSPSGTKSLCFDYINTSGSDVLTILLSTDGGVTFPTTLATLTTTSSWVNQNITINSNSATSVIRFRATSDFGVTDIGIDNLFLGLPSLPNCATYTSPANGSTNLICGIDAILNWTAPAITTCNPATSYDVYFGTSPTPPLVTNVTTLFYNPGNLLPSTTYYWRIVPRNSNGPGTCTTVWSFTTGGSYSPSNTSPPLFDGLENCTDWVIVNGTQVNKWIRGTATAFAGSNSMYINNTGTNNDYTINTSAVVHFYKDIYFPAGTNDYTLNFFWKGVGESSYDFLRVFFAPTSITPVAGTQVSSTYELTPFIYNQSSTWQPVSVQLPLNCSGNQTMRLIFSWRNDGSAGTQPPAAVDNIEIVMTPRTGTTCANPTNITLPYSASNHTTKCMNDDYFNTTTPCAGNNYVLDEDRVYKAIIGAAGCVNITLSNASSNSIGFQVYDNCPDAGGNCIFNSTTGASGGTLSADINIPAAGFYYIIVDSWNAPGDFVNYDINISTPGGNTASDPCTGAVPLTLGISSNGDNTCTNAIGEPAQPACWTTGNMNTVWFRVTIPPSRDVIIKTTAGSLLRTQIDAYRGNSCSGLTYVGCNQDAASCGTSYDHSYLYLMDIPGSDTYLYIRVDGENNLVGTFSILALDGNNVATPVLPPIPGQDCGPVITHTNPICGQNTNVPNPGNYAFGNLCDFTGAGPLCLASGERSSTWYTININANGTLAFDIVPNDWPGAPSTTATDYDWALWRWEAACDGLADNTFCCAEIAAGINAATRCNYNSLGVTGMFTTAGTAPAAYPGFGGAYEASLAVTNGEIYVLVVTNFANNYTSGYSLNFSGTSPIAYSTPGSTMTWNSTTSNTWLSPGNWGGCGPPNCGINGVIAAGGAQPVISSNVTVKDLTIDAGATLTINPGVTVTICGNFTNNGTLIAAPNSTILFNNGSVNHTISGNFTGANKIGNLVINKTGGNVSLACNLDIGGNFVTQNATSILNVANYYLKVAGNFNTAANTTITNCPTIEFNGTIPQTYQNNSGTLTWNNVVMNNTGGGMTLVGGATSNLVISGSLTLTSGIIYTANSPILIMNAGSTSTQGNANSFVDGPMEKIGNTAFVFPVGDAFNRWRRIAISAPSVSSTFRAQYFYTPYSSLTPMASTPLPVLNNVSQIEYWQLDRVAGTGSSSVTLYWENAQSSGINSCAPLQGGDLVVARWNGSAWENRSNTIVGGITGSCVGTAAGTVTSDVLSAFSPFTFASKSALVNPLPVELISFSGKTIDNYNLLTWITRTETNNDFFTLQRSTDGYTFEDLAKIKGAGNSNEVLNYSFKDVNPYSGNNYYRLMQTDFDGETKYYHDLIVLNNSNTQVNVNLFPNPFADNLNIVFNSSSNEKIKIEVTDMVGRQVYFEEKNCINGINQFNVQLEKVNSGIYYLKISSTETEDINITQKIVKQ